MATINNPHLAGSPIMYTAAVAIRQNVTFQRVRLTVVVSDDNEDSRQFEFSVPVTADGVSMDLSSALQAVIDSRQPTPSLPVSPDAYPVFSITVTATEEWMVNGQIQTLALGSVSTSKIYAGHYTDAERIYKALPSLWSRKPTTSPEIAYVGCPHIVPGQRAPQVDGDPWIDPSASESTVIAGLSGNVYGIAKPAYGHELRFINSLGIHENVFVSGLPAKKVNITTEKVAITRQETFSEFSRGMAYKQNDYETWRLNSGPLDEAWLSYFVHEVLMARNVWIEIEGHYVPCHILPEEGTTLVDRENDDMMSVELVVELDINGSPV